jgi:glycosyltransferase involved in cell wall biosynthesis
MDFPKISIVTVNYNMAPFLERAILSVLDQQYPELEYIIIDGGSNDGSIEIIKKYADRLSYWVSEKDNGQSDALNKGLSRCTGDIVAWLNADDYYEPGAFLKAIEAFKNNPECGVVLGACRVFENGVPDHIVKTEKITEKSLTQYWKSYFIPPQPAIFWKKSIMDKTGLLKEYYCYCMDLDLWLRFSKVTRFACIPDLLAHAELHPLSKSGSEGRFNKFVPEWTEICKSHVARADWWFRIWHTWAKCSFMFNLKLNNYLDKIRYVFMSVLGLLVAGFKRITGIRQLGILSKKADS